MVVLESLKQSNECKDILFSMFTVYHFCYYCQCHDYEKKRKKQTGVESHSDSDAVKVSLHTSQLYMIMYDVQDIRRADVCVRTQKDDKKPRGHS